MARKIVFKRNWLLGKSVLHSRAMQKIMRADTKHILNFEGERRELFEELKKYRENGVTGSELRRALAKFKFTKDSLTSREARVLAKELGIKKTISKKDLSDDDRSIAKDIAEQPALHQAQHRAGYLRSKIPRAVATTGYSRAHKKTQKEKVTTVAPKADKEKRTDTLYGAHAARPNSFESYRHVAYGHTLAEKEPYAADEESSDAI